MFPPYLSYHTPFTSPHPLPLPHSGLVNLQYIFSQFYFNIIIHPSPLCKVQHMVATQLDIFVQSNNIDYTINGFTMSNACYLQLSELYVIYGHYIVRCVYSHMLC